MYILMIYYGIERGDDFILIELSRVDDNIVITKVKENKELTLDEIFKDYDGEYAVEEFDWGSPVGREV